MTPDVTLSPRQAVIVTTAVDELKKKGLSLVDYRVSLYPFRGSVVVLFESERAPAGQRGSPTGTPSFEVEIDSDLVVKRANYVR